MKLEPLGNCDTISLNWDETGIFVDWKSQPTRHMWEGGLADRVEIGCHVAHMVVLLLVTLFFRITCQTTLFVGRWPSRSGMIGFRATNTVVYQC